MHLLKYSVNNYTYSAHRLNLLSHTWITEINMRRGQDLKAIEVEVNMNVREIPLMFCEI